MANLLLTNATILNWSPRVVLPNQAILIREGRIAKIGDSESLTANEGGLPIYDCEGALVLPGAICAHTHFYGAFARGMAIPGVPPRDFPEILRRLWWGLDRALTLDDVRYSALLCLIDAIHGGTTTLIDHHASPNAIDGSLSVIAAAVEEAGLRGVLCYEVTDRDGAERAQAGIAENVRFLREMERRQDDRLAATFGLHASLTLSEETLRACTTANEPFGSGFHIHLAEHEADEEDSLARSGVRTTLRLKHHRILGARTIAAHAVHVDASEVALLRETETWVTHQPRSNMNNGVGVASLDELLRAGIKVCLGNDGFSHFMIDEWRAA
ncbi:MAG TPA: amidohydrolase family protein, partial [Aggregatilineales bacterium]|nr:amidohydrolase family protein [Aggregatilineales bacterium]